MPPPRECNFGEWDFEAVLAKLVAEPPHHRHPPASSHPPQHVLIRRACGARVAMALCQAFGTMSLGCRTPISASARSLSSTPAIRGCSVLQSECLEL